MSFVRLINVFLAAPLDESRFHNFIIFADLDCREILTVEQFSCCLNGTADDFGYLHRREKYKFKTQGQFSVSYDIPEFFCLILMIELKYCIIITVI